MESLDQSQRKQELPPHAQRVVRLIYIVMGVMILLPFILVWLTGAIRFEGS